MNLLSLIPGREYRRCGGKHGGEFSGGCPFCGDGGKGAASDRFHVWPGQGPTGRYWCRMCGAAGDGIQYLRETEGLGYKEACDRWGIIAQEMPQVKATRPAGFVPAQASRPGTVWQERALKFAEFCHGRLLESAEPLAWLAERGITRPLIEHYRLGWNPSHAWRERSAWGLPAELKADGKAKKLWLPMGLVIPMLQDGAVIRLRIRQPDGDPRYFVVPGSSREPLVSKLDAAMVIVESELDAILLDGEAGDAVGIVAMGNDTAKPPAELFAALKAAEHISVSLDSDTPRRNRVTGKMEIPGGKASRWWLEQFPQAARVPVIGGKDPGDAYKSGVDLRSWVLAGLSPYFRVRAGMVMQGAASMKGSPLTPTLSREGRGDDPASVPQCLSASVPGTEEPAIRIIILKDGREFTVTEDQSEWWAATESGGVAFSGNELRRLQVVFSGMDADERRQATSLVMDLKEVFPGAHIRDGRAI